MTDFSKSAPVDREFNGPLDSHEVRDVKPFVDFGSLRVFGQETLALRLEIEESTQRVVAVTLEQSGSTLQLQAFAAPRNDGLWHEIRAELLTSIVDQGGSATDQVGVFGPELLAIMPSAEGSAELPRVLRFIGVDGPRWFLRGIVEGLATSDPLAAVAIDDLFRSIVVFRGDDPVPPRELLELKIPDGVIAPPRSI